MGQTTQAHGRLTTLEITLGLGGLLNMNLKIRAAGFPFSPPITSREYTATRRQLPTYRARYRDDIATVKRHRKRPFPAGPNLQRTTSGDVAVPPRVADRSRVRPDRPNRRSKT